jgi:hypothetical protein
VIYESSDDVINTNYGWMLGDVVPLNSCAYVVSQSTEYDGSTLTIKNNFEQWVLSIAANADLQQRQVQLRQNYAKSFTTTHTDGATAITDVIRSNEKVYWYPYWGCFYWISWGEMVLRCDLGFDTSDDAVVEPANDPCQSEKPIFLCDGLSDSDCYREGSYGFQDSIGTNSALNTFIDHVWVYKFMYLSLYSANDSRF